MTVEPAPYLPPPTRCESLAAIVGRFGGSTRMKPDIPPIDLGGPAQATEEVRAFLRRPETTPPPTQSVAGLPNGRVFGAGVVLAPDGRSIARDVSLDFGHPDDTHWLLNDKKIRPPQVLAGRTAVIASTLGGGYCHWLLDELPRLLSLKKTEGASALIAHSAAECSRTALQLFGWTGALIEPARRGHWQSEELIVPSLPGWTGRATAPQIQMIREFVEPLQAKATVAGERIYISRMLARRRRVTNDAAVIAELAGHGFVEVKLEELSWEEQIAVFRYAKVVVAPHGAGLANLAFCERGTRVIEFFGRAYLNGCFWQIAALRGLHYQPLVPVGSEPLSQNPKNNRLDITVDLEQLRAALT
ncbi:MAG: glycosyltransferase family 61 protein [Undibacterium sp.]|nr:glycosyltransferase family 61 protein [Opitutaceae bacterium]